MKLNMRLRSAVRDARVARLRLRLPAAAAVVLMVAVSFLCGYQYRDSK